MAEMHYKKQDYNIDQFVAKLTVYEGLIDLYYKDLSVSNKFSSINN